MDLVNSVTQNSNNRNTTMENGGTNDGGGDDSKRGNQFGGPKDAAGQQQKVAAGQPPKADRPQVPDYLRAIGMDPRKFWPKKYRFTREKSPGQHNPLTIAQRNFYETNGYIVLDDCVPRRLIEQIKQSKQQSVANNVVDYQQTANNNTNQNVVGGRQSDFVDEFLLDKLLVKNGRLAQYVKCFCDEKFMLMTHRLVEHFQPSHVMAKDLIDSSTKLPKDFNEGSLESQLLAANNNSRQSLFRDWIYLPFRPIDKVVCTVVALDSIEHVILVVPGTHRVGQCTISSTLDSISAAYDSSQEKSSGQLQISREIYESSPEKLSTLVDKSRKGFKYVNLKAGQTLFYHPGLVHGYSSDLVNFRKRQLASLAYYAAADCEFVDLRNPIAALNEQQQQQQQQRENNGLASSQREEIPISLAHFGDKSPRDYRSWLDKPRLVGEPRASL